MQVRCFDILWDTDGEDYELPNECIIETDLEESELHYHLADKLSDKYDFCVFGCHYEII